MITEEEIISCWRSISDALVKNRCWLCGRVFQRGKVKKTFTVEQLVRHLCDNKGNNTAPPDKNEALARCVLAFEGLGREEGRLWESIQAAGLQGWMSGLVCCQSIKCLEAYSHLTLGNLAEPASFALPARNVSSNDADCPPNCNCDNPW